MTDNKFLLKLFITGQSTHSERAIKNIKRICEIELGGEYHLQIINILETPQLAEDERIIATPTLIKVLPKPLRRVIGDLSNTEQVLLGLDLVAVNKSENEGNSHE
jgi:circadian clock protein KaiB